MCSEAAHCNCHLFFLWFIPRQCDGMEAIFLTMQIYLAALWNSRPTLEVVSVSCCLWQCCRQQPSFFDRNCHRVQWKDMYEGTSGKRQNFCSLQLLPSARTSGDTDLQLQPSSPTEDWIAGALSYGYGLNNIGMVVFTLANRMEMRWTSVFHDAVM